MNSMLKLFAMLALVASVAFVGCDDDDDPVTCNWTQELQDELNAFIQASTNYNNNMTTENCNAYRAAGQAYLDAADDYQSCANAAGQGAEYAQAIADAQAELNLIVC